MITKKQFLDYEHIRESGQFNMIMDANIVMQLINLTKNEYFDIITNYSNYSNQYLN